jgi:hypothetical protein
MVNRLRAGVLVLIAAGAVTTIYAQQQIAFFVAATTQTGETVTDLKAEEVVFAEGDKRGTVVRVAPVDWPVKVTVLVDNGVGTGPMLSLYRTGLKALFAALPTGVEAALLTLAPQPRFVVRPTNDRVQLVNAVERLAPDESAPRMVEGLIEAAKRVDDENKKELKYFPVFVVLSTTGPEGSTTQARLVDRMVTQLTNYPARVHVIMLSNSGQSASSVVAVGARQVQLGKTIADLTGGRYEAIAAASAIPTLLGEFGAMIADAHNFQSRQYMVTAERPAGATGPMGQLGAGSTRPGVKFTVTAQGLKP